MEVNGFQRSHSFHTTESGASIPPQLTRGDSIRDYLTGAGSGGGVQTNPLLSLGNYRSSTELVSWGVLLSSPIQNISVDFASGGCPAGQGILTLEDANSLNFQDSLSSSPGDPLHLYGNGDNGIVETAGNASSFLRITRTSNSPMSGGPCTVLVEPIFNNVYAFDNVTSTEANAGESQYLASIVKNVSASPVQTYFRWMATLGLPQNSSTINLGASGSGTINTAGTFASWPAQGWCQIQTAGGSLREIVYYLSRTNTVLTVSTTCRGLLGTIAAIGATGDVLNAIPGVAIAKDTNGVQNANSAILTIANINTAPAGVTWNTGITQATGLNIGLINPGQEVGFWYWRQIPAGAKATPASLIQYNQSFDAF